MGAMAHIPPSVRNLFSSLSDIVSSADDLFLPPIPLPTALDICSTATIVYSTEPTLLQLNGSFFVVGDLHGHALDLLRILAEFGMPPASRYLFLGDLVDRGDFSIHTALFVFALKCIAPHSVFTIRGNHEFAEVNSCCGLLDQVMEMYQCAEIFEGLNHAFSVLPLAACINGDLLCVHGGIGPELARVDQIAGIRRPLVDFSDPVVEELMWSDPSVDCEMRKSGRRGRGYEFGERALGEFLERNRLRMIVRGHEAIQEGVVYGLGGKVVTVFSASGDCGAVGVLEVSENGETAHRLAVLPCEQRKKEMDPHMMGIRGRGLSCAGPRQVGGGHGPPVVVIDVLRHTRVPQRNLIARERRAISLID
jgi:protein phosphatase